MKQLNTAVSKFQTMDIMVTGNAWKNWNTVVNNLDDALRNTDAGWEEGMKRYALRYCGPNSRRYQKQMIQTQLKLPKGVRPKAFWIRLMTIARYMKYLPSGSNPNAFLLSKEELRDALVAAMPSGIEKQMKTVNYKWDDPNKTDMEVVTYLNDLHTICNKSGFIEKGRKRKFRQKRNKYKK